MTNIIEKLARAIAKVEHNGHEAAPAYWENEDTGCNLYRVMARAVLQTLHDNITPEMVEAGASAELTEAEPSGPRDAEIVFQAMIATALKGERA